MSWIDWQSMRASLLELGNRVGGLLSESQQRNYREYVMAGEEGLAMECLADWLSENETPITVDVRRRMLELGAAMRVNDRVATALARCPNARDQAE